MSLIKPRQFYQLSSISNNFKLEVDTKLCSYIPYFGVSRLFMGATV